MKYVINNITRRRRYKKNNRVLVGMLWLALITGIALYMALSVGN
jgi:hypothetical protein